MTRYIQKDEIRTFIKLSCLKDEGNKKNIYLKLNLEDLVNDLNYLKQYLN